MPPRRIALPGLVMDFIEVESWEELRNILKKNRRMLLSSDADAIFEQLIRQARLTGDRGAKHVFELHYNLVKRCREIGIDAAFEEVTERMNKRALQIPMARLIKRFINIRTWDESEQLVKDNADVLLGDPEAVESVFETLLRLTPDDADLHRLLETHHRLLKRCREIGIKAAFEEIKLKAIQNQPDQKLRLLLTRLIETDSRQEARGIVREHRFSLLADETGTLLGQLIEQAQALDSEMATDPHTTLQSAADIFVYYRRLLKRCREIGVDAAFAEAEKR